MSAVDGGGKRRGGEAVGGAHVTVKGGAGVGMKIFDERDDDDALAVAVAEPDVLSLAAGDALVDSLREGKDDTVAALEGTEN